MIGTWSLRPRLRRIFKFDSGQEAHKRGWHLNSPKTVAWAKLLSLILDLWKHSVDLISTCMSSTLWVLVRELWYSEQQTVFLRRNNFDQVCLSLWSVWIRIFEKSKGEIYQISTQNWFTVTFVMFKCYALSLFPPKCRCMTHKFNTLIAHTTLKSHLFFLLSRFSWYLNLNIILNCSVSYAIPTSALLKQIPNISNKGLLLYFN